MEVSILWGLIAGVCGLGCGAFLGDALYQELYRRRLAVSVLAPTKKEQVALRVRGGARPLIPVARRLLLQRNLRNLCDDAVMLMEEAGMPTTKEAFLSLVLSGALALFAVG